MSTHKLTRYLRLKATASKSKIFASKKEKEEHWIRQYDEEFPPLSETSPQPTRDEKIEFMRARGKARYEDHVRREEEKAQRKKKEKEEKQAKKLALEKELEDIHVQEMQRVFEGLTFYIWYQVVDGTEQDCPTASRMRDQADELRREEEELQREEEDARYYREVLEERKTIEEEKKRAERKKANKAILRDPTSSSEAKGEARKVLDQMKADEEHDDSVFEYEGLRYAFSLQRNWRVQTEESQLLETRLAQWRKMNDARPEWRRWKWNM